MIKLYTYFRSSAAYRVRIALNLKGLPYESVPVHLLKNGGEHLQAAYRTVNPEALIPALQDGQATLTQSLAIMEYLDEVYPEPALLPQEALDRARARALALAIACDIHPVNNLRVLKYLTRTLGISEDAKNEWYRHWLREGLAALEAQLEREGSGPFCVGDTPTIADCCLVPQVFNARRFQVDLAPYPRIAAIDAHCNTLQTFIDAHPSRQPDTEA